MLKQTDAYLNELYLQKAEMANNLSARGVPITAKDSFSSIVHKVSQAIGTCFYATGNQNNSYTILVKLKGNGPVSIVIDDEEVTYELGEETYTEVIITKQNEEEKFYLIKNIENVTQIDISNSGVTKFIANEKNNINKLVLHNNNIENLDVSKCKNLQFLHIFNNPICGDIEEMQKVIRQLPDRNNKPFGSIILYDWVNLGLCGHRNPEDGLFYYDKEFVYTCLLNINSGIFGLW